jgi:hypothetical protein
MSLELLCAHKSGDGMSVTFVTEHGIEPMEGTYEEFARLAEVMAQVSVLATVNDHESVWIEEVAVGDAVVMLGLRPGGNTRMRIRRPQSGPICGSSPGEGS